MATSQMFLAMTSKSKTGCHEVTGEGWQLKGKFMEKIIEYSPIIVVILMFFVQQKIFVTPEQLEKKHREIIDEIEEKYVSMNSFIDLKEQFSEVKDKIDKIYDLLIDLK